MTHNVAVLCFYNIEALDFAGPSKVFTTASRIHACTDLQVETLFSVQGVSRDVTPVQPRAGLRVLHKAASLPQQVSAPGLTCACI